ncbi:response regulator transcription factor [Acetoanaerobium noterae]|uniref:response regulator transcription factor n=1 Tax=Acetoanaerobium noterae TaxID=745369 RepID=UPI003341DE5E
MDKGILEQLLESSRYQFLKDRKKDLHNVLKSLAYFSFSPEKNDFEVVYNFFHILKGAGGLNLNRLSDIGNEAQELLYEVEEENNISDNTLVKLIKLIGEVIKIIDERLGSYEDDVEQLSEEKKNEEIIISRLSNNNQSYNARKRILIVDDVILISNLIKTRISNLDYEIEVAKDGEEALEKIALFKPNLILLDIMLPKLSGVEVLKRIKEDKSNQYIKIIILSAKTKDKDILECIRLGADDFMTKPFSLEVLEEKIKALLRN